MKFILVSVKDKITGEFMNPIPCHNDEDAKRLFSIQIDRNEIWRKNPEQFEMYILGELDTKSGNLSVHVNEEEMDELNIKYDKIPVIHPEFLCKGTDILEPRKE